ncbi:Transmembrane protein 144a [Balamuthia mandrillaris]
MAEWVGFLAAAVAVIFFGSNYVPVKQFEAGDGIFFQFILCAGIWFDGLIVQFIRQSEFNAIGLIGGVMWCIGNLTVVPIVKTIGLGLGLLIWGMVALVMGWASGNFGLFGLNKNSVAISWLNYLGVSIALFSVCIYAFVKPEVGKKGTTKKIATIQDSSSGSSLEIGERETDGLLPINSDLETLQEPKAPTETNPLDRIFDRLGPMQKRIVGVSLSLFSGCCYGLNFDPAQWEIDHHKGSSNGLDYVFSQFCGIMMTATFFMFVYAILMRNKPLIYPSIILPGFISGVMWGIAQIAYFVANQELGFTVSFPIVSTGPGAVGSLWGIFLFKEITGWRNLVPFSIACCFNIIAVVLITISKVGV